MSADPDGLRDLFLRHHRELRVFASRLADPAEARDLVQEAFLRLLQHAEAERIAEPRAFLYKTLSRLAVDWGRRRRVGARPFSDAGVEADHVISPHPAPETFAEGSQALKRLQESLAELSPRCRDAFLLHRVDGARHDEIAARFGVTVRTVERDIAKALDHLTARLSR